MHTQSSVIPKSALLPAGVHLLPLTFRGKCVIVVTDDAGETLAADVVAPCASMLDACAALLDRTEQRERDRRTAEHVEKGLRFLFAM